MSNDIKNILQKRNYRSIIKKNKSLSNHILNSFETDDLDIAIYCLKNNLESVPHCSYLNCAKPIQFDTNTKKLTKGCCKKHSMKISMLEKYGVENPSQSEELKRKRTKTMLEKYGVENYSQTEEYKKKTKKTSLEKYMVFHTSLNQK